MKISCENCKKCGEIYCGNDSKNLTCYEPLILQNINKEIIITIKRHLKGIEKAISKLK